jgi:hypothetical protein
LYNGSNLAAKIVEKRPTEMFRRGYDLESDDADADELVKLREKSDAMRADENFLEAHIWGGLFGGALLIIGADDGQTPEKPLNEDNIKTIQYCNLVDRRFIWVQSYYSDPLQPNYGLPQTYLVTNTVSQGAAAPALQGTFKTAAAVIHESRCIRFDGTPTDVLTRQQNAGWTLSILQRVYDRLKKFEHSFDSTEHLLGDASQAVFKFAGLLDAISNNQSLIQTRLAIMDETRSVARAVLLDAGDGGTTPAESFSREATTFTGIADILGLEMMLVACAADMPQTELFGRSPAGLNATGDSDTRKWYDTIASDQTRKLMPKQVRWFTLLAKAKDSPVKKRDAKIKISYKPLWSPTDTEQATVDLTRAQMDVAYITAEVVTAEEVALDRQDLYPSMDTDARESAMKAGQSHDPYPEDDLDPAIIQAPQQGESTNPSVPIPLPGPRVVSQVKNGSTAKQ